MSANTKNTMILRATIVEPIGNVDPLINGNAERYNENVMCINIAVTKHTNEMITAEIVTDLNVLKSLIELKVGKIINAETRSEPTSFMATTIIVPIIMATIKL